MERPYSKIHRKNSFNWEITKQRVYTYLKYIFNNFKQFLYL